MTHTHTHTQVLVVGGGPVGMLVAAELGHHGVATVLLEAEPRTVDRPKAGTLHARTAQGLARRGHLPAPLATAELLGRGRADAFHFAGMPGLAITAPATEPGPVLGRSQADLERDFEHRARERGVTVLRGHRVTDIVPGPDTVRVTAQGPDGLRQFTAEYAVGADGARSTVRERLGFVADTHPATMSALLGLVRLPDPESVPYGWHRTPHGWTVAGVSPYGHSRFITMDFRGPHPDRRSPPTLDELRREAGRILGHRVPMADPRFLSRFSDFARLVRRYRQDRVFLAGDAAHIHFPVGGQGLNLGLQDALNLSWKLAHTLAGSAGKDLLDTYDAERRPAGQRVIDNTRAQLALMRPDPGLDPLRDLVTELLAIDAVGAHVGHMISAQETVYPARTGRGSRWEGRFLPNLPLTTVDGPTDLTRLLLPGRPLLLLLGEAGRAHGEQGAGWAHAVRTVSATTARPLPWDAVLVRPDGYIAWAPDGGSLAGALDHWFGEPRRQA
ncbi:FAD-dependent monooxygenase [Streptomyces xanthophaeus]|uniref:FAD-dependent monooxygenase n=1 Tax=Streptomyces xanthophaeus TaxID=67385 RepID=UPI002649D6A6|nr:FAD-dependent monooxygenase [Streptomyces xanthophaeus]WKD33699.1 FAD-dependent monooxygenase [Streptomyces xanthophaeus]